MRYTVKVEDTPFIKNVPNRKEAVKQPKTVSIIFYEEDGSIHEKKEYGLIEEVDIKKQIELNQDIDISYCYINKLDFSNIALKSFNAQNAFIGSVNFSSVQFDGNADFGLTIFAGEANFEFSRFKEDVSFVEVYFEQEVCFWDTKFYEGACFDEAKFNRVASFSGAKFRGETSFKKAKFVEDADFEETIIGGNASMFELEAKSLMLNNCIIEKTLDLRNMKIEKLSVLYGSIPGIINIEWKDVKEVILDGMEGNVNEKPRHLDVSQQYRLLKENFRTLGQYDDEDRAYVLFRRHENLANFSCETANWGNIFKKCKCIFIKFVADFIGLYATSPTRILLAVIGNMLIFALLYYLAGFGHLQTSNEIETLFGNHDFARFKASLYFSAITSFTVGYGDLSPKNEIIAWMACIESFLGVFLMSYFTVAFSRKILR